MYPQQNGASTAQDGFKGVFRREWSVFVGRVETELGKLPRAGVK